MRTVKVQCEFVSPLLMDRMTDQTLDELISGVRVQKPRDRHPKDVAREKLYRESYSDGNGQKDGPIGLPGELLFSCLVSAGRNVKAGKKQISTAKTTTLPDFMSIREFFVPLVNGGSSIEDLWVPDKRRGRLPDGTAIGIIRPKVPAGVRFELTIDYDEKKADESVIRALVTNAGSAQGLGAFRPNCKGPFGRFKIVAWDKVEAEAKS